MDYHIAASLAVDAFIHAKQSGNNNFAAPVYEKMYIQWLNTSLQIEIK